MKPELIVHSVISFTNLLFMKDSTLPFTQMVSALFHSPTGTSTESPCSGTGVFLSLPLCSLASAPYIKNKSPCRVCLPCTCTQRGQTLPPGWMWTRMPVLSAWGAILTKRQTTVRK